MEYKKISNAGKQRESQFTTADIGTTAGDIPEFIIKRNYGVKSIEYGL